MDSVLKHFAESRKRRLSALPNVGLYIYIYSVRYYPRLYITTVGLETYYPWIQGHYCISYGKASRA
jgi:hypothetical protein